MVKITNKEIEKAANEYALKELGPEQFKTNEWAVKAITQTFKDGIDWVIDYAIKKDASQN